MKEVVQDLQEKQFRDYHVLHISQRSPHSTEIGLSYASFHITLMLLVATTFNGSPVANLINILQS